MDTTIPSDIPKRRDAELALNVSVEFAGSLIRSMQDGLSVLDADGVQLDANPAFCEMTGFSREELIGVRPPFPYWPPEERERIQAALGRRLKGDFTPFELTFMRKNGERFPVMMSPFGVRNPEGRIVNHLATIKDISERKRAEEELRTANQKLKLHFEQTQMAVVEWDLDFRVVEWNPAAQTVFGFSREEAVGQHASFIVPETYRKHVHQVWRDLLTKTGGERSTNENVRKDGGGILCEWYNTPLVDGRGKVIGVASVVMDITERKLAEERIRVLNATLERRVEARTRELQGANKELEAFSYSVSHDLKAPLRAVDGFLGIVVENYADRLDDKGRQMLGLIHDGVQRMGELIDELLEFSRMGRHPMEPSEIDMSTMAQEVFERLGALEPERKLRLDLRPLPPASGTRPMIRQVWANLIGNAIKFTKEREVAEIEIGAQDGGEGGPIYYVKDNGAGFDMRQVGRLFNVFQRLHSVEEFEGAGVGLAIVQRIVQRHGGRAWAEGEVKRGAAFYFTLPNPIK